MTTMHIQIKSGKPGKAMPHSDYIAREGNFRKGDKAEDLVSKGHGNLPNGIEDPRIFWKAADNGERVNGAAYREMVVALPLEFTDAQRLELVQQFILRELGEKPYQYAIHAPYATVAGGRQPHAHIMFSDRSPDGIRRAPEMYFRRFNATAPERGGCRKDSGGLDPVSLKQRVTRRRENWASIQNELLAKYGHESRVDHRSHRDRGISKKPEIHLGPAAIRSMSSREKADYIAARSNSTSDRSGLYPAGGA